MFIDREYEERDSPTEDLGCEHSHDFLALALCLWATRIKAVEVTGTRPG
jgi:hypothetical protein